MFTMSVPWWEFVVRGIVIYIFLLGMLRLTGRRQTGQLAPFDLVLLLILSNAVQNSMNAGDNSLVGGMISASTLISLHYLLAFLAYRNKKIEIFLEGKPKVLINDGVLNKDTLRTELLTHHEVIAALRSVGCEDIQKVKSAIVENNGQISIKLK